jgi:hypothetical protein
MSTFLDGPRAWVALARTGRAVAVLWTALLVPWLVSTIRTGRATETTTGALALAAAVMVLGAVPVTLWLLHGPMRSGRPGLVRPLALLALVVGSAASAGMLLILFLVLYAYAPPGGGTRKPSFEPDLVVSADGADAWEIRSLAPPARRIRGASRVQALVHSGGWVMVRCPDGWEGWVDGRQVERQRS